VFEVHLWNDWINSDISDRGFILTRRTMSRCGAELTLHDLSYEWPQGFSRSGVRAMNPNIGKLSVLGSYLFTAKESQIRGTSSDLKQISPFYL
jgi:hypothetical protein